MKKLILALTLSVFCFTAYADLADDNAKAGKKYLEDNKKKHQVVSLTDGLQYKILIPGKDKTNKPTDGSEVTVEYTGRLINGTVFDSTDKHGGSATFPIDGVIPGWTEVLKLMPVGSTWEVYIPANLAYGERAPDSIGPNQTLIFKIKLMSFKKA